MTSSSLQWLRKIGVSYIDLLLGIELLVLDAYRLEVEANQVEIVS